MSSNLDFSIWFWKTQQFLFSGVGVSCEKGRFFITVYKNPTLSGIHTHFGSSPSSTYEFGTIYTLFNRRFAICFGRTKSHDR